jgi:GT2 family glycosyltransferase
MNNPLLSIIIVSFNTAKLTLDCLRSIIADKGLKDIPYEIIIVDNDSKDDSISKIKEFKIKHSLKSANWQIKIIANKHNSGFGTANNQGVAIAKGNYILLLNSDTIILHSAISQSLNWLSAHPEACACTAQLLNKDKTIQASGGYFPNLLNVFAWSSGLDDLPFVNKIIKPFHPHTPEFYTKDNFFLKDHQQDWITGAFFLTRKNLYDKVKGFDENYFMYGEEVELCYRLKKNTKNNQIWYLIGPQIIHLGGASAVSRFNPIFNEYQGVISFFKKHKPFYQTFLVKYILKINAFLRSIFYYLVNKKETASFYQQACQKI